MLHVTVYVTVAVRKHVMVAVSPHVTAPGRVCVSVYAQGYVSSVSVEEEKLYDVSPDSQA